MSLETKGATIALLLLMYGLWYLGGTSKASRDGQYRLTTNTHMRLPKWVTLPSWARKLLFFNAPNPFRWQTVTFQAVNLTATIISIGIILVFPKTETLSYGVVGTHLALMVFLMVALDQVR